MKKKQSHIKPFANDNAARKWRSSPRVLMVNLEDVILGARFKYENWGTVTITEGPGDAGGCRGYYQGRDIALALCKLEPIEEADK